MADLNGDGANDLVVSMILGGLAVRLNDGSGGFGPAVTVGHQPPLDFDLAPRGFALADFNRDGRVDIAAGTGTALEVLLGAGDGTFAAAVSYGMAGGDPLTVTAIDIDRDTDVDLILDDQDSDALLLFRNNGSGVFAPVQLVPTGLQEPALPVVADFNRDGSLDFAVGAFSNAFSVILRLLRQLPGPHRTRPACRA